MEKRIFFNEPHNWQGACLETDAKSVVIGLPQARAYC